jgi:hypothetical protein
MEQESCSYCQLVPEEILTMDCGHEICLTCARADAIFKGKPALVCRVCQARTLLPPETVSRLDPSRPLESSASRRGNRWYCREHGDEPLMYFCMDCLSKCICA